MNNKLSVGLRISSLLSRTCGVPRAVVVPQAGSRPFASTAIPAFVLANLALAPFSAATAQQLPRETIVQLANNAAVSAWGDTKGVDIAAPDKNGISHNIYTDLSVGTAGLVLNNSVKGAQAQELGFMVGANPNLTKAGKAANLILMK